MTTPIEIDLNIEGIMPMSYIGTIADTSTNRVTLTGEGTPTSTAVRLKKGVYTLTVAWRGGCGINSILYDPATAQAVPQGVITAGGGYRTLTVKINATVDSTSLYFVPQGATSSDLSSTLSVELLPTPLGTL